MRNFNLICRFLIIKWMLFIVVMTFIIDRLQTKTDFIAWIGLFFAGMIMYILTAIEEENEEETK